MTAGPQPPPPGSRTDAALARMPATHVVPTVDSIVKDAYALIKGELDAIKARTVTSKAGMTPADARTLESLMRSLKVASDTDGALERMVREAMGTLGEDELKSLATGGGHD